MGTPLPPIQNSQLQTNSASLKGKGGGLLDYIVNGIQSNPIVKGAEQTAGDLANAATAPIGDTVAYARLQMDPKGKAKLAAINNNPKLSQDDKISQGNALMQQYEINPGQDQSAQRGSENFFGAMSGNDAINSAVDVAAPAVSATAKAGIQAVKQTASDTADAVVQGAKNVGTAYQNSPLSSQAGFIKIPGLPDEDYTPGQLLDAKGNPVTHPTQPTENGSYIIDNRGDLQPNPNPQSSVRSVDTSATNQTETQPSTGYPTIPEQTNLGTPEGNGNAQSNYPFQSKPNILQKVGTGQNQDIRQIRYKGSQNAVAQENQANETLDRLGVKGSAQDQLAAIPQKKQQIYDWIKGVSSMATNPKYVSMDEIKTAITTEVKKQFGNLPPDQVNQIVDQQMNDVYGRAAQDQQNIITQGGKNPYFSNTSDIVPNKLDSRSVYNMKVAANNTPEVDSAFDKIMNGQKGALTPEEKVALASRNAYDSIISKAHPDVKTATNDLSVLNDRNVYGSLESARFNVPPPPQVIPKTVFGTSTGGLNKLITKIPGAVNNPVGRLVLAGGVGAGTMYGGTKLYNELTNKNYTNADQGGQPSDKSMHTMPNITQSVNSVNDVPNALKSVASGNTNIQIGSPDTIKSADGTHAIGISYDAYQAESQKLQDETKDPQYLNNIYYKQKVDADIKNLDTKYNDPNNMQLNKNYNNYTTMEQVKSSSLNALQKASPNLTKLFGIGKFNYDTFRQQTEPAYTGLQTQLANMIALYPQAADQLKQASTLDDLKSVIAGVDMFAKSQYLTGINTAAGGQTSGEIQAPVAPQVPQTSNVSSSMPAPHVPISIYNGQNGSDNGTQMPSIGNLQSLGASFLPR